MMMMIFFSREVCCPTYLHMLLQAKLAARLPRPIASPVAQSQSMASQIASLRAPRSPLWLCGSLEEPKCLVGDYHASAQAIDYCQRLPQ